VDQEILALALTFLVHVLGVAALIWHLLQNDEERPDWGGWFRDDGDDPRPPDAPGAGPPGGALPLPDAAPSTVRLREPGRLSDARPGPARRPAHPPERSPERSPGASAGAERRP
jgi:hypothetical protein